MNIKIPKNKKDDLHGQLRALLARFQISYKEASELVGESYQTFRQYVRINGYNEAKIERFIKQIDEAINNSVGSGK